MSKNIFATSFTMALLALPLLGGCKNGGGSIIIPMGGVSLPDCAAGQFLTVGPDKALNCTTAGSASLTPKACPSGYAETLENGMFTCGALGTGTTNADLSAAITNLVTKTTNLQTQINNYGGGGGAARYCGLTATQTNGGRIDAGGGVLGVAAAAKICEAVTGCGTGAHMCTPYEMFESISAGTPNQNTAAFGKAWVYLAAWQNFDSTAEEPTAGLSDNCGGFTYPTSDKKWRGAAIKWETVSTGPKVMKLYTGAADAPCNQNLPIACCK